MVQAVQKDLVVPSTTRSLKEMRDFVRETLDAASIGDQDRRRIILATDEAVTNIVTHRASDPTASEVAVRMDINEVRIRIVIEDRGEDIDPGPLALPDLEKALRGEGTRCIGIFLIRQAMDEVNYRFKKGFENELEMIRFIV